MTATPKQPLPLPARDWYPYYAGFTEQFVESVLSKHLQEPRRILDPWSGSGTTAAVCARNGIQFSGVDINPATNVLAFARLSPRSEASGAAEKALGLLSGQDVAKAGIVEGDLLTLWFEADTVNTIRALENVLARSSGANLTRPRNPLPEFVALLPRSMCLLYVALFATVRRLLRSFRTSNPTWLRTPRPEEPKLYATIDAIHSDFSAQLRTIIELTIDRVDCSWTRSSPFISRSAAILPFRTGSFDACITSPPYATRIDYVQALLPELAVLGANRAVVSNLRTVSTGTPVVRGYTPASRMHGSDKATAILDSVENHSSKGSRSYYYPWLHKYFESLQASLNEASRTVKASGRLAIVVQDSYFKDLPIDLQGVVTEMLSHNGRELVEQVDFAVPNLRSRQNPRAGRHKIDRENTESLLVFQ